METKEDILVFTLVLCLLALSQDRSSKRDRDDLNHVEQGDKHFSELFGINVIPSRCNECLIERGERGEWLGKSRS